LLAAPQKYVKSTLPTPKNNRLLDIFLPFQILLDRLSVAKHGKHFISHLSFSKKGQEAL